MLKVLIVDDEYMILKGFKYMVPWEENGYRVVGEAGNGLNALNLIRKLGPDIVLTDIRMPGMSGMEMIHEAARLRLGCKFVIISGYEDFRCCQEALRLGVSDYLLKPIDFSTVIGKLDCVAQAIRQEKQLNDSRASGYFARVFSGAVTEGEAADMDFLPKHYRFCVVAARPADGSAADLAMLPAGGEALIYRGMNGETAFFVAAVRDSTSAPGCKTACEHAVAELFRSTQVPQVYTGAGALCTAEEIRRSCQQAVELVENRVFYGRADCTPIERDAHDTDGDAEMRALIGHVAEAVRRGDETGAVRALKTLFERFASILLPKADAVRILRKMLAQIDGLYVCDQLKEAGKDAAGVKLSAIPTLVEMRKTMLTLIHNSVEAASAGGANTVSIEKIKEYVNQHCMENITLSSTAKVFFLNSSYLSRLFSKKGNITFTDYLNQQRVDISKHLLCTTELSIEQIAERVGFSDYHYYARVFKKYNDSAASPQEFRKAMRYQAPARITS